MYTPREEDVKRCQNNFVHHPPSGDGQVSRYEANRWGCLALATDLLHRCPPSRELSLALTKLEEVMFWANAAIARNE